jgi:hypothetical protein
MSTQEVVSRWRLIGAITGLLAVAAYTLLVAVPLPDKLAAVAASMFGPLVGCASIGLYRVLAWGRETVAGFLAAIANVVAGALVVAMLLVQIALADAEDQAPGLDASTERVFDHVHFGLDLSWDTFICLGTFLFGLAMLRRPGFGLVVGGAGICGEDAEAKRQVGELLESFGWPAEHIRDLGDISSARHRDVRRPMAASVGIARHRPLQHRRGAR